MNERITIGDQEYELTPGICGDTTHVNHPVHGLAPLSREATTFEALPSATCIGTRLTIYAPNGGVYCEVGYINEHQIQPLKLIERKPVEFNAEFALIGSYWYPMHTLDDAQGTDNNKKMRFRCVQITEEA